MPSILGGLPALLGLGNQADDLDEMKTVPNRADRRRAGYRHPVSGPPLVRIENAKGDAVDVDVPSRSGARMGPRVPLSRVTRHAAGTHPLAITETNRSAAARRAAEIDAARLTLAFNEQQALDEEERPTWVFPWVEQAWRNRRAATRRQRAARRASR